MRGEGIQFHILIVCNSNAIQCKEMFMKFLKLKFLTWFVPNIY